MQRFDYFDPNGTILAMCEGNPGAVEAMFAMYSASIAGLSGDDRQPWEMVKICDELEVYGSRLYMLWNDCLGRDTHKMAALARLYRADKITGAEILEHIRGDGCRGRPFAHPELQAE